MHTNRLTRLKSTIIISAFYAGIVPILRICPDARDFEQGQGAKGVGIPNDFASSSSLSGQSKRFNSLLRELFG
ncbi:hypothetical protein BH18THE2_BH18THE2_39120 [soil metagenome]